MYNPSFVINGRYLGQSVTGVQRYAREIVREIDNLLQAAGRRAALAFPTSTPAETAFTAISPRALGGASGHLWEQAILPLRVQPPLLSLCNVGPVLIHRQIICMHDTNVYDEPDSYSSVYRWVYQQLMPLLARRAAIITSVSRTSAESLACHLNLPVSEIPVISNGHEHVFRWNAAAAELKVTRLINRPFVLLLGSAAKHKNANFILRQATVLDTLGLDLVVAGGRSQIFTQTHSHDAANIYQLGFVTDDDLAWLYSHALCLAFPSLSEGFGIPVVEAMALGCPIVSSNRSCLPEICGDAALLGNPEDEEQWLTHFRSLAASQSLCNELRGRGLERVQQFSWRASAQAYIDLLARL